MFYKINHGYGLAPKKYQTLKGAKIACNRFCKLSGVNWLDIVRFKNGNIESHITYTFKGVKK